MPEIKVLPQNVADKIAAGEVVERPSAAIKELVENAVDAGADQIRVEIKNGGVKYILVADNGCGIPKDQLEAAFVRHATSKLREIDDLYRINTMGFRGEALASICAVAEVQVFSRTEDSDEGVTMTIKNGIASPKSEVACNCGTTMVIENLFSNVPARMKFLKKDSTEAGYVADVLERMALANPGIAFDYICDGKEVFSTSGDGKPENVILNIYGIEYAKAVIKTDYTEHGVHIHGMVGKAEIARGNRTRQTLLVNGRYIKNHVVAKVIEEAYRNVLMTGKFPFFVLNIDLDPQLVDVNVHPAKTEVKFANEREIYNIVHCAVKNALYNTSKFGSDGAGAEHQKTTPLQKSNAGDVSTFANMGASPQKTNTASAIVDTSPDRDVIKEFMQNTIPTHRNLNRPTAFREPQPMVEKFFSETGNVTSFPKHVKCTEQKTEKPQEVFDTGHDAEFGVLLQSFEPKQEQADLFSNLEPADKAEDKSPIRVTGQIFDTYLVCQQGENMYLIDQHAAHERKRFEMLKKDYTNKKVSGQILLSPIVLDVDGIELQAVKDNAELLSDMGFEIEEFGKKSVIIRETPITADEDDIKGLAIEVISALKDGRPMGMPSFAERLLDMISCKYAIKANKRLSILEMEALVKDVEELERQGITTCPHGRPIKVVFTKREIEKMFKRIV